MWDMDGDALDGLDMRALEALADQLRDRQVGQVSVPAATKKKLNLARNRVIKHGFDEASIENINETVEIVIRLPLYMVIGMRLAEGSYREAVRDYLVSKGASRWAASRFVISGEGDAMRARDLFTRRTR